MEIKLYKINYDEIVSQLAQDGFGKPLKTIENYLILWETDANLRGLIRFNELSGSPENARTGRIWNEEDDSLVRAYIEYTYKLRSKDCYNDAFNIVCGKNKYNPIKQVLESAIWDGQPRIATILQKYLNCDDTDYTKEVARLIFAGGIARLYEPGCKFDFMPILLGTQGSGKSTFVRWLAINDSWFKEVTEFEGQAGREALEGAWICEVGELLALTKSKEVEAVKSYITRQNDNYRKPYERRVTDNPRKCIFIGTTNRSQFLTDKTGNRRFLPINVKPNTILFEKEKQCREDILQCWLEAKHNYDIGQYSLTVKPELLGEVKSKQDDCVEDDWRVGVMEKYLENKQTTCVKDIWDNAFNYSDRVITKKDSNDICSIIDSKFNEWYKTRVRFINYGVQRGWRKDTKQIRLVEVTEEEIKDLPF